MFKESLKHIINIIRNFIIMVALGQFKLQIIIKIIVMIANSQLSFIEYQRFINYLAIVNKLILIDIKLAIKSNN